MSLQGDPSPAPGEQVQLIVLAVRQRNIVAGLGDPRQRVILRPQSRIWEVAEGEIVSVTVQRSWIYARTQYLSATIDSTGVDVSAWGLPPLALNPVGQWDPRKEMEADMPPAFAGTPGGQLLQAIIQVGPRPAFEMEQVLPGADPDDPDSDPITDAVDARHRGDPDAACKLLQDCLLGDLRCIDAHTHLGHFKLDDGQSEWRAQAAQKHYAVGVAVADQALGPNFSGVLPWGWVDNRPFLRCLHGSGLAAWRLGDHAAALRIMERLLWLDPTDPFGVASQLAPIRSGQPCAAEDDGEYH